MEKARKYRGLFIIAPDQEENLEVVSGRIKSVITENGGTVQGEELLGKRELAYPIRKREEAVYLEVAFEAVPSGIAKMNRQYRIDNDILRALLDRHE